MRDVYVYENLNFKNFNYALIDSAKKDYKEVLVTYEVDGNPARQFVFVNEIKGQGNAYYVNKSKEVINERINNGQLLKTGQSAPTTCSEVHIYVVKNRY